MKKILRITLIDNKVIDKDITLDKIAPFGSPANSEEYAGVCLFVATHGTTDPDNVNEKHLKYIAPSQIKSVEIIFE